MKRLIDARCSNCRTTQEDLWLGVDDPLPNCSICGAQTYRLYTSSTERSGTAGDDSIPGGMEMQHGMCNSDGTPRKFYSKGEIAREAAKCGLHNHVEHMTRPDTDKAAHTTRWV